ncbi:hypothetical protein GOODEAATRI_001298 [Goodea atripinnis]|uniref:Uncharacterized protein n=1 Tax=Goodea atripinnis TaxID=208336 RepID=A0ABV0PUH4_9TELE
MFILDALNMARGSVPKVTNRIVPGPVCGSRELSQRLVVHLPISVTWHGLCTPCYIQNGREDALTDEVHLYRQLHEPSMRVHKDNEMDLYDPHGDCCYNR